MELSWPFLATISISFSSALGFVLIWVSVSKHNNPDYKHVAASVFVNMLKGAEDYGSGDSWASHGSVEHKKKSKEQDISYTVKNSCRGLRRRRKKNGSCEQIWSGPVRLQLNWLPKGYLFWFLSTNMQVCFSFGLCLSHVLGATLPCLLPHQCLESGTASAEKSTTLAKGTQGGCSTAGEDAFSSEQAGNKRYLPLACKISPRPLANFSPPRCDRNGISWSQFGFIWLVVLHTKHGQL